MKQPGLPELLGASHILGPSELPPTRKFRAWLPGSLRNVLEIQDPRFGVCMVAEACNANSQSLAAESTSPVTDTGVLCHQLRKIKPAWKNRISDMGRASTGCTLKLFYCLLATLAPPLSWLPIDFVLVVSCTQQEHVMRGKATRPTTL